MSICIRTPGGSWLIGIIPVLAAFWGTVLLGGPSHLYFTNRVEFALPYSEIVGVLLPITGLCVLVTLLGMWLLREKYSQRMLAVLFSSTILLWLEGNLLVYNYGILDGRKIDWSANQFFVFADLLLWIGGLTLSVVFYRKVNSIARTGALFLIALQLISNMVLWYQNPVSATSADWMIDHKDKFRFSSEKNVIVLVVDSFRSDFFQEIAAEDPQIKADLMGFTYFRNAVSGFPITHTTVPLILTGQYYDNSIPIQSFMERAFTTSSISKALKEAGYDAQLYPFEYLEKTIYTNPAIASNIVAKDRFGFEEMKKTALLCDVAWFRYFPHLAKPYLYSNDQWLLSRTFTEIMTHGKSAPGTADATEAGAGRFDAQSMKMSKDLQFMSAMLDHATADMKVPSFKYFHLKGLHAPLTIDANLKFTAMEFTPQNYKRQALATIKLIRLFLQKLRAIGAYENALIVILGDHGSSFDWTTAKDRDFLGIDSDITEVKDKGRPLLLLKRAGATTEFAVSDAPVSHGDLCQTIGKEVGLEKSFPGRSVFEISPDEKRVRKFYFGRFRTDVEQSDYLSPFVEYEVIGHSWQDGSWHKTGKVFYAPKSKAAQSPAPYTGQKISFGVGGSYQAFQAGGWDREDHTYTVIGDVPALLRLSMPRSRPVLLRALLSPTAGDPESKVIVKANGSKIAEWNVARPDFYVAKVPAANGQNILELSFEVEQNKEAASRRLAQVAIGSLVAARYYALGDSVTFGIAGNAVQYQLNGWSHPERGINWTNGLEATLAFPLLKPEPFLLLKARLFPYLNPPERLRQTAGLFVNNARVDTWLVDKEGLYKSIIPLQQSNDGIITLKFSVPEAIRPVDIGADAMDARLLALCFQSLTLEAIPEYRFGQILTFGKHGDGNQYLGDGWGEPQAGFVWTTNCNEASLWLPITSVRKNLRLNLYLAPLMAAGKLERQRVAILANGHEVGELKVDHAGDYSVRIPKELVGDHVLKLTFRLPDAISQFELGLNSDPTVLAVQFWKLAVSEDSER